MADGRNWQKTLHPASFKGVPFETERDVEEGGRRIVVHEFPMRDDPFLEDLGEAKRDFDVTAYVASDNADGEAAALSAVCAQRGAGLLILPTQGQIFVKCLSFRRDSEKDRAGKIAFALKFVREGAASSLVTFASLANLVIVRSDTIAAAVAAFAAAEIAAIGQPDFVIEASTDALSDGAAIFETVRKSETVDQDVSAAQRVAIQAFYDAAPAMADADHGADGLAIAVIVSIARALGDGMPPDTAVRAFEQIMEDATISPRDHYLSKAAARADANRVAVYLAIRLAAATAYAEGIARLDIRDRQTAITLRANVAEYFEAILAAMSANDADLYRATVDLQGATIDYLSRVILDRAPVIQVGANRRMPSLWWSFRLYANADRSQEIADRNRVAHPSFCPLGMEVLSR